MKTWKGDSWRCRAIKEHQDSSITLLYDSSCNRQPMVYRRRKISYYEVRAWASFTLQHRNQIIKDCLWKLSIRWTGIKALSGTVGDHDLKKINSCVLVLRHWFVKKKKKEDFLPFQMFTIKVFFTPMVNTGLCFSYIAMSLSNCQRL